MLAGIIKIHHFNPWLSYYIINSFILQILDKIMTWDKQSSKHNTVNTAYI